MTDDDRSWVRCDADDGAGMRCALPRAHEGECDWISEAEWTIAPSCRDYSRLRAELAAAKARAEKAEAALSAVLAARDGLGSMIFTDDQYDSGASKEFAAAIVRARAALAPSAPAPSLRCAKCGFVDPMRAIRAGGVTFATVPDPCCAECPVPSAPAPEPPPAKPSALQPCPCGEPGDVRVYSETSYVDLCATHAPRDAVQKALADAGIDVAPAVAKVLAAVHAEPPPAFAVGQRVRVKHSAAIWAHRVVGRVGSVLEPTNPVYVRVQVDGVRMEDRSDTSFPLLPDELELAPAPAAPCGTTPFVDDHHMHGGTSDRPCPKCEVRP